MSNLLPRSTKQAILLEYRVRIAALWCFVVSGAVLIGTLLFVPAYVLIQSELSYVTSELRNNETDSQTTYRETLAAINRANTLGRVLAQNTDTFTVTDLLREIDVELRPSISFQGITYAHHEDGTPKIEILGTAATREELAQFVERLKRNPHFRDASVPFGQLAQAKNAPFTITLAIRPEIPSP